MGACESTNADGNRKARSRGEGLGNSKNKRTATKMPKLAKADLDSSRQVEEEEIDKRVEILRNGQKKELQKMVDNYEEDINDYAFGTNKTLLLEAVINCPNPAVIDMIMEKGADIDKEESRLNWKYAKEFIMQDSGFQIEPINTGIIVYEMPEK